MNGEAYAYGRLCTWHGPLTFAMPARGVDADGEPRYVCPMCGRELKVTTVETYWRTANFFALASYREILRWSEGRCFQDFAALREAYERTMEGEG